MLYFFQYLSCCQIDTIIWNKIKWKKFMNFPKEKIYCTISFWSNITGIMKRMEKSCMLILMKPEKSGSHFFKDYLTVLDFL